jgi:hypothetical protein
MSNSGTLASNTQNTANPKYNDDISSLISQYHISATANNPELREEGALELPNQISQFLQTDDFTVIDPVLAICEKNIFTKSKPRSK